MQIYEFLEAVIIGDAATVETCSEKLGWNDKYKEISNIIYEIVDNTKNRNTQDIYQCFCRYLAGNKELSAFLTRVTKRQFEYETV